MLSIHPVRGKAKSEMLCDAFRRGAPADAVGDVFYGVDDSNVDAWKETKANGGYWYIDNSYLDATRGTHFRVTRNALQHSGIGNTDGTRFRALNIAVDPWREDGKHIVVCPQSDQFMRVLAEYPGDWFDEITDALLKVTNRPLRVRNWNPDKLKLAATLGDDLRDAHALVTYSSAAAVTAVLAGVPIVCDPICAAAPLAGKIVEIEHLPKNGGRYQWAGVLADNQFTVDEMKSGAAWQRLNA